jgi:hypothetical protein
VRVPNRQKSWSGQRERRAPAGVRGGAEVHRRLDVALGSAAPVGERKCVTNPKMYRHPVGGTDGRPINLELAADVG